MAELVEHLMDPRTRFDYSSVQNNTPAHVRKCIRDYVHGFFQQALSLGETGAERSRALDDSRVKRAVLHALGGWAGLESSENLPAAKTEERRVLDLTRGFFKLLMVELMPWVLYPKRWSIQYFNIDSMLTHAMLHGIGSVSIWQSLCLVLLPDSYIYMYVMYQGFGHNKGAPVKVGDSASDPLVSYAPYVMTPAAIRFCCWFCTADEYVLCSPTRVDLVLRCQWERRLGTVRRSQVLPDADSKATR
jgi:hypothetical protein